MEKEYLIVVKNRKNKLVENYYMPEIDDFEIITKMLKIYDEAIKVFNCKILIIDENGKTILDIGEN